MHEKDKLLKENDLPKKNISALKAEVSESAEKTSFGFYELQKIVKLLKFDIEKMVNSSKNLDLMLGNQRPCFEKSSLRYEKKENKEQFKNSQSEVPVCIYCFKKSHFSEKCFSLRKAKKERK